MLIEKFYLKDKTVAVVTGEEKVITDAQSALDLIMTARYETGTNLIAVDKEAITEDFFVLSRGLAGEVLQKFINYEAKIAIFGDFSQYTSKPPAAAHCMAALWRNGDKTLSHVLQYP